MPAIYVLIPGMIVGYCLAHWGRFSQKPKDHVLAFLGFALGVTLAWVTVDPWMLLALVVIVPAIVWRRRRTTH